MKTTILIETKEGNHAVHSDSSSRSKIVELVAKHCKLNKIEQGKLWVMVRDTPYGSVESALRQYRKTNPGFGLSEEVTESVIETPKTAEPEPGWDIPADLDPLEEPKKKKTK